MPKILQVNITANWGSHGRIAERIGQLATSSGWESYIAYGRWANSSKSQLIRIGSMWDERLHGLQSRLFDSHGLASKHATCKLVNQIKSIHPDIIHLHNIHGYYLNYPILFDYLSTCQAPVVWTLHDCWPVTGHCSHFMVTGCKKWKTGCYNCEEKHEYPAAWGIDCSRRNYSIKSKCFNSVENLTLVAVSDWQSGIVGESFLKGKRICRIYNGIDLDTFHPIMGVWNNQGKKKIIAVASKWTERKGLNDVLRLHRQLGDEYEITIIGLNKRQAENMPKGIKGVIRTDSLEELATNYSSADVFINPTYEDNFPTTNIEALACGTPVVTYRTGGSPEAIDNETGLVVETGNIEALAGAIQEICGRDQREILRQKCRLRAERLYNQEDRFREYIDLYESLLSKT